MSVPFFPVQTVELSIPIVIIEKAKDRALRSGISLNDVLSAALFDYLSIPAVDTIDEITTAFYLVYPTVKKRTGFSNVTLADVQDALRCDLRLFHAMLSIESKKGRVVLSTGDWSLASNRERKAGMRHGYTMRLYVRVKGGAA